MLRASLAALTVAAILPLSLHAQSYPAKPVRVIVPFPPGAGVDITTRLITPRLSDAFGQPFVVDNRAGAAGNIGADLAAHSPADGYTLLTAPASVAIGQTLYKKPGFDLIKDFGRSRSLPQCRSFSLYIRRFL